MSSSPPGGPSTINGILYQMLWCLVRASEIRLTNVQLESDGNPSNAVQLILEPLHGGDVLVTNAKMIVVQLKTKAGEGPWSLRSIIEEVLPDLYKAVPDTDAVDFEYQFITDGRSGNWSAVAKFFESLEPSPASVADLLQEQSFTAPIKFQRKTKTKTKFWKQRHYTRKLLFEHIATVIGKDDITKKKPLALVHEKTWRLLSRLRFIWRETEQKLRATIDSALKAQINAVEHLDKTRNALIGALAAEACRGNVTINASVFFEAHGLSATSLGHWSILLKNAREKIIFHLDTVEYDPHLDVRTDRVKLTMRDWTLNRPVLVFSGESGQGKSWQLYAVATVTADLKEFVVLVESTNDGNRDLELVSKRIWQEIAGHDLPIDISRIAERVRQATFFGKSAWITILIDGVRNADAARILSIQPWEKWGARFAMSASKEATEATFRAKKGDCAISKTEDFSQQEIESLLKRRYGEGAKSIPYDVVQVLRFPILAGLYCRLSKIAWHPTSEYDLYQQHWNQLKSDGAHLLDANRLRHLVSGIFIGQLPPWTDNQIAAALHDDATLERLIKRGWLRQSPNVNGYELPHDRLLNWALGESFVEQFLSNSASFGVVAAGIFECLTKGEVGGRDMSDVPGDFFYLLLKNSHNKELETISLLAELEPAAPTELARLCQDLSKAVVTSTHALLLDRMNKLGAGLMHPQTSN